MSKMRLGLKNAWLFLLTIGTDQISKLWAIRKLEGGERSLLPHLKLKLSFNEGSAFGIRIVESKTTWVILSLILILALCLIPYKSKKFSIAKKLIISGTIGNLIDRLIYGKVVDFIKLSFWPSFNIADTMITIGLILAILDLFGREKTYAS